MNYLLRPRIWPSFRASSGVPSASLPATTLGTGRTGSPCDVPFRYASEPIPRCRGTVDRWHAYLHGLATLIHETSGLVLVVFVILFTAVTTSATEPEPMSTKNGAAWLHAIRTGVLKHDVDDLWSGTRKEGGVDLNAEIIFNRPSFSLLSGNVRPNLGASINTQGDTSKIYGGILWEFALKSGIFLNLGIGAAVHNGELDTSQEDKKSLGSRVLLRIPIEIGYSLSEHHQISILFDHVSNAFLVDPNEGLDTLGLRYGYRF